MASEDSAESVFRKFLGVQRWRQLIDAVRSHGEIQPLPELGTSAVIGAIVISLLPGVATVIAKQLNDDIFDIPSLTMGVCALLAMVLRAFFGIRYKPVFNWRRSLSVTHTAVAFGCIPAVIILAVNHDLLAEREQMFSSLSHLPSAPGTPPPLIAVLPYVAAIAAWASITEEVIYRAFLLSVLRRWRVLKSQRSRDTFAIVVSALVFGGVHLVTWGPYAAIALAGLGLGFVLAYIANGEQLLPLILYHFLFDCLSIGISVFPV